MRICCQGIPIGDFSPPHCGLYPSCLGFKALPARLPSLWREEFDGLGDRELWNLLDGKLYGFHGDIELEDDRSSGELERDGRIYSPYNFLTNWGEQFDDGGKSFIVCTPFRQVRILNLDLPRGKGLALTTSISHMSAAIHPFLSWFETEAARLGHLVD